MSRKKLSRTVIEGGRYGRNKWERRNSHNEERTSERDYCQKVSKDPEYADDDDFIVKKTKVHKDFRDKLSPMYRWLHSQVGRLWDDVYSEVKTKFDDRTTAGRHIVNDHLKSSVSLPNDPYDVAYAYRYRDTGDDLTSYSENDFYVDDEGILQVKRHISRKQPVEKFDTNRITNWLSGRVVGRIGNKYFWFIPSDKNKKRGGETRQWNCSWGYKKTYYYYGSNGLHYEFLTTRPIYGINKDPFGNRVVTGEEKVWVDGFPNFRQDRKLSNKDLQFWNSLPKYYQNEILKHSPVNKDEFPAKSPYGY